ncbi:hypothetical protein SAMN05216316_2404 [Nitrosovibrio sp. Nv6]|nr:hypothetical protein SAMN05216316_2404 [Nitrosovibrio sp. Nv6]
MRSPDMTLGHWEEPSGNAQNQAVIQKQISRDEYSCLVCAFEQTRFMFHEKLDAAQSTNTMTNTISKRNQPGRYGLKGIS